MFEQYISSHVLHFYFSLRKEISALDCIIIALHLVFTIISKER